MPFQSSTVGMLEALLNACELAFLEGQIMRDLLIQGRRT